MAEKVEAMITRGVTNTRMKDFYDVHVLASSFGFDGTRLREAIRTTFSRRETPFPIGEPIFPTIEFLGAPERRAVWRAFLRRGRLEATPDTERLAAALMAFLGPVLAAASEDTPFTATWPPGGPWR